MRRQQSDQTTPGTRRIWFDGVKSKVWGLYRNRLQKPENGAGEAMQPPKNRLQQKEKHHTSYEVQCFFGGEYRDRTGDLLHAMQALSQLS